MTNRSVSAPRNYTAPNRLHLQFNQRLEQIDDGFRFAQMNCNDSLTLVGEAQDPWEPNEMAEARGRMHDLASDPAHGGKMNSGSVEEAVVALYAMQLGVFGDLERENSGGAEFVDDENVPWDVKSPRSPSSGQNWNFSADHQLEVVRKDIGQGDNVLLNLSLLNETDRDATLTVLSEGLSCDQRGRLLILTDSPSVT